MLLSQHYIKQRGFTLIELLVVLVLIGIMYSYAVLSVGQAGLERELDEEAKRIFSLIKLAREESILKSREFVMEIQETGYIFKVEHEGKYVPSAIKVLRERKIAQGLELVLHTENDTHIFYGDEDKSTEISFLPDGEQTTFELIIKIIDSDKSYYLSGEKYGVISFSTEKNKNT